MGKFYIVFRRLEEDGSPRNFDNTPMKIHTNFEDAQREAYRLAERVRGSFYVMETVGVAKPVPVVEWYDL